MTLTRLILLPALALCSGCATLTNDKTTPVTIYLSDGSNGVCRIKNNKMDEHHYVPNTINVFRSDNDLALYCESYNGKVGQSTVPTKADTDKIMMNSLLDLNGIGIFIDYVNDAHRYYPDVWVVPVAGRPIFGGR